MYDDDDILIVEESFSTSFTRRSAPLREIEIVDEPGPSASNLGLNSWNVPPCGANARYEKLQQVEELIARAKANSLSTRPPKITIPEVVDLEKGKEIQAVSEQKIDEVPVKKRRKKEPTEAQLLKQQEKKRKAIEREKSAAIKTKCEQYMYCHVSRRIFDSFPDFELQTRMLFMERNIPDQLICDEQRADMRVLWYRKCIDAVEVDGGGVERQEYEALQHIFAVVLSTDSFKEIVKSNSLEDFVATQKLTYSVPNSTLLVILIGEQSRNLFDLSISLFDCYRTQLHYVHKADEFAIFLAHISRALAKMERRLEHQDRLIVNVQKGIKDAAPHDLIRDWWHKMLAVIPRLQDAHRRAIVDSYPNPILASKRFSEMGYKLAVEEIAEIISESGRRLGPAMAHRIFMILTDRSGTEVVA